MNWLSGGIEFGNLNANVVGVHVLSLNWQVYIWQISKIHQNKHLIKLSHHVVHHTSTFPPYGINKKLYVQQCNNVGQVLIARF